MNKWTIFKIFLAMCIFIVFMAIFLSDLVMANCCSFLIQATKNRISGLDTNEIMTVYRDVGFSNGTGTADKDTKKKTFRILYWTGSFYHGTHWFGEGERPFRSCKYSNCLATSDRTFYNSSDAVLMLMNYIRDYPEYRFPNQKWILHNLEAPTHACKEGCKEYNGLFNATSSYYRGSEIRANYSHNLFVKTSPLSHKDTQPLRNYAKGKSKLVAWFVSSYEAQSKRMAYAQKLKQYIPVDIYGAMAPFTSRLKCPKSRHSACLELLKRDYKFYLSFENSLCMDYVTEKLWKAINTDTVPIVMGAFNYSSFLPPKSYIDIKDFDSPKDLANYLKLLDKNDTLYNEYMSWKESYTITKLPPPQCAFCEYLNLAANVSKVYQRMDLFWDVGRQCQSPEDFYSNMDRTVWEHVGESIVHGMGMLP